MADFNKILVAVAFSSRYTEGIFQYSTQLATRLDAELVVASIINQRDVAAVGRVANMGYEVDGEHYVSDIKKERLSKIDQMIKANGFPPERVKSMVKVGNPIDELLRIVDGEKVDMVVMGLKGRTDLEHVFVGSVAEKLFRRCPATIVSYRDDDQARRLRKRIH